ncbi:MAG TPA: ATP-binding protein [Chitinophagaceae bacterium]|nr:ATP-binding protein [Chitinophagaceae bacterium]
MIKRFKKQRLAFITLVYWFLLIYIVAALVWWFISLENQNTQMFIYRLVQINKNDPAYNQKLAQIKDERKRKTTQYIGEGSTFLLVILVGAVFVYRSTKKQIILSHQQQNFMMAVTHELKTPIAVVRLNLETLQKYKLDETKQQKLISNTLLETERLNTLTNNILVAAELESGHYTLNKQEINFSALVKASVKDFHNRFHNRIIDEHTEENIFVTGETLLLQMLANNLLDNAFKYSDKDAAVKVDLRKINNKAVLKIIDEGEGIADAEKKKIFQKFYRVGNETTRKAKGTGLGLYLCKRIVHDHKGTITVQNNIVRGSIFYVSLQAI